MSSRKQILAILVFMFSIVYGFSQTESQTNRDRERFEEKVNKLKTELISDTVNALKIDDFKKHIATQSIESYFVEITKIYSYNLPELEVQDLIIKLEESHFNDLKTILDQEQIDFILAQIKGDWKKNRKKNKKKRKKDKN